MKKLCFLTALAALTILGEGYGAEKTKNTNYKPGIQSYGKETLAAIQANGSVILEGTQVLGSVKVNGSLQADQAVIDSLQINGKADLKSCLIKNSADINGSLMANNTEFLHELSVASEKITLIKYSANALIVRPVEGFKGAQIIDLRSGTKVNGPIVVESGNGEIWLSSNSVASGKITGTKIVKK